MFFKITYSLAFLLCCTGLGMCVFYALREPVAENVARRVAPALQADTNSLDIGKIRQQETQDVTFRLRNTTQNDLSLESVLASCVCTEWHLDKRRLTSGESAELSVTFSSGLARNRLGATIQVFYKDLGTEETGDLFLELIADVLPDYDISPPFLDFTEEAEMVQYVSLKSRFAENIRVLDVSCTRSYSVTMGSKSLGANRRRRW